MAPTSHPITSAFGILFAVVGLPLLVFLAWQKAAAFDPFSQSFFTKEYIEPTADMPREIRIGGWVFIAIGVLLALEPAIAAVRGKLKAKHALLMLWLGALVATFGGAFFAAADSAQLRIEEEMSHETRAA
ncbi:MAG: hypothetical protein AAGK17_07185 [Pseudomonadota bacterium]